MEEVRRKQPAAEHRAECAGASRPASIIGIVEGVW